MTLDAGELYGRGISFPPRVGSDGRIAWSEGEDNVRESIRVLLLTRRRERLMLPDFGGGLDRYLFEPNTVATRQLIQNEIERVLARWEPRVKVETVTVEQDERDAVAAVATIQYRLVATQQRERVSVTLTLGGN
jgi:phage baseplate assembly protein W